MTVNIAEVKDTTAMKTNGYVIQYKEPRTEWSTKMQQNFGVCKSHYSFLITS